MIGTYRWSRCRPKVVRRREVESPALRRCSSSKESLRVARYHRVNRLDQNPHVQEAETQAFLEGRSSNPRPSPLPLSLPARAEAKVHECLRARDQEDSARKAKCELQTCDGPSKIRRLT